jgi:hypothetical protein
LIGVALGIGLLTTSAAATADSADARLFQGKTGQGYKIKLNVKEARFKILRFEADLRCSDGTGLTLIEGGFLWTRTGSKGSFRDAQFGRTDDVYFRGRLSENRIQGRVRLTDELRKGVKCRSRWIRFNASAS